MRTIGLDRSLINKQRKCDLNQQFKIENIGLGLRKVHNRNCRSLELNWTWSNFQLHVKLSNSMALQELGEAYSIMICYSYKAPFTRYDLSRAICSIRQIVRSENSYN